MGVTKHKGDLAEAKVLAFLVGKGIRVSLPWSENSRYDLVAEKDGRYLRIQVKYVSPKNGRLSVPLRSANNWKVVKYKREDLDIVAAYDPESDKIYFIPLSMFNNSATINLRLIGPKNGQKKSIIFAADYEGILF